MNTFDQIGLNGIKRKAKIEKKARGIAHSVALDIVAKAYGYQNFAHARRVLGDKEKSK